MLKSSTKKHPHSCRCELDRRWTWLSACSWEICFFFGPITRSHLRWSHLLRWYPSPLALGRWMRSVLVIRTTRTVRMSFLFTPVLATWRTAAVTPNTIRSAMRTAGGPAANPVQVRTSETPLPMSATPAVALHQRGVLHMMWQNYRTAPSF